MAAKQPSGEKLIKRLLSENRLNVDEAVKIVSLSDASKFKLLIQSKLFDPKDFSVKTIGNKLVIVAYYEEKELDETTIVKQHLCYEHELPKNVDPNTVKAYFPVQGFLEIEAPRVKR